MRIKSPRRWPISRRAFERRHTILLAAIATAFVVRPLLGNLRIATELFSIALLILMLVALYTVRIDELIGERTRLIKQKRRKSQIGWILALPALVTRVALFFVPSWHLDVIGSIAWFLFFAFVTWSEVRGVLKQKEINGETISMAISGYLLMGLTWGVFYVVLFSLHPESFNLGATAPAKGSADIQFAFPVLIYFSLTTLSTVGYGDITPLSLQARYAAVAEAIVGQFYLAILVARLVGLQMSQAASKPEAEPPEKANIQSGD
jgi:amino acid transporter